MGVTDAVVDLHAPAAAIDPARRRESRLTAGLARRALPVVTLTGIAAGGVAWLGGQPTVAAACWAVTTGVILLPLVFGVFRDLVRGRVGVDLIALMAMAGAVLLGEYLAGAVIALMLSGGQALEDYAGNRARRELFGLASRAPRHAHRVGPDGLSTIASADLVPGDLIVVTPGEVVPVDGVLSGEVATLDESALTGEAVPVLRRAGYHVESGVVNAGGPMEMRATATAAASTYAGIVRLAEEAQRSRAPFVRMADRYATIFLPITFAVAGAAWAFSGQPVRALAVLVVATPCPLILAAPVAIVGGISRAARRGVVLKNGAALEALAGARVLLVDKTGTLTAGHPRVADVHVTAGQDPDEVLRLAASLDQVSSHVFARSIVEAAREAKLRLEFPTQVEEAAGAGIRGIVGGRQVALGRLDWLSHAGAGQGAAELARRVWLDGGSAVYVAVGGRVAGALALEDSLRPDAARTIRALRRAGIERVVMVTGDHPDVAASVGEAVGVDRVLSEHSPAEKVEAVRQERTYGPTVFVGDGVNDAAALAAADIGVAIGARGATASSEAADAVLVTDRLDRLAEAMVTARRSRGIATQSVVAGMAMSAVAMLFAAAGRLSPVAGAVLQEVIDVAVILNALRSLGGSPGTAAGQAAVRLGRRVQEEHARLEPVLRELHVLAHALEVLHPAQATERLRALQRVLVEELLPHEEDDDAHLYPAVARVMGGNDPTAVMSRAHLEIRHLVRRLARLVDQVPEAGPSASEIPELRRLLYSLDAVMRLHMAQEEESYLPLLEP